ncbi:hypothetical protein BBP40_007926 [Aspergillus hancockii]|nr:hypothetical protein BBP40_007926 [Aspergillus hancockii]
MANLAASIRDNLEHLEQLVRKAGENKIGDQIRHIIQSPNQINALNKVFVRYFRKSRRPAEIESERRNFFTHFRSRNETLTLRQINDLVSVTKDWQLNDERVPVLKAFAELWRTHPALFWHGAPDNEPTRRCIEELERMRETDPSRRKALLILLSEDIEHEQKRILGPESTDTRTGEEIRLINDGIHQSPDGSHAESWDASRQDSTRASAVNDPESLTATTRYFHDSLLQLPNVSSLHEGASLNNTRDDFEPLVNTTEYFHDSLLQLPNVFSLHEGASLNNTGYDLESLVTTVEYFYNNSSHTLVEASKNFFLDRHYIAVPEYSETQEKMY